VVAQGIAALVAVAALVVVVAIVGVGAGVDAIGLAIAEVDTFNLLRLRRLRLFARISLLRHLLRHHHHLFAIARLIASPFVFLLFASLSVVQ